MKQNGRRQLRQQVRKYCKENNIRFEEEDNHFYIRYCQIGLSYDYGEKPISLNKLNAQVKKYPVLYTAMKCHLVIFVSCENCCGCSGW